MNKLKKIMKEYFNEDLVSVKILEKGKVRNENGF